MKFREITKETKVFPGEFLLHEPSKNIVLVGAFNWESDFVRALSKGKVFEDRISHFKKIVLNEKERKQRLKGRCKGCKGR
jgi:MoaA/NifB/PqqE/SkfB family radical SAM enzyme